jgi:hypothetical protein
MTLNPIATTGEMQISPPGHDIAGQNALDAPASEGSRLVSRPPPQDARGRNLSGDPYVRQVMEKFAKETTLEGQMAVLREGFKGWWIDERTVLFSGDQQGDLNGKVMALLLSPSCSRGLIALDTAWEAVFGDGSRHVLSSEDIAQAMGSYFTGDTRVTRDGTLVSGQFLNDATIGAAGLNSLRNRIKEFEEAFSQGEENFRACWRARNEYQEWCREFDEAHGISSGSGAYQPSAGAIFYLDRLPPSVEQLLPAGSPLLGKPLEAKTFQEAIDLQHAVNKEIKAHNPQAGQVHIWTNFESGTPFKHREQVSQMLDLLNENTQQYIATYVPQANVGTFDFGKEQKALRTMLAHDERWCDQYRSLGSAMDVLAMASSHYNNFVKSWEAMALDPAAIKSGKAFQQAFALDFAPKVKENGNVDIRFSSESANPNYTGPGSGPIMTRVDAVKEVSGSEYWKIRVKFEELEELERLASSKPAEMYVRSEKFKAHPNDITLNSLTHQQAYQTVLAECEAAAIQMFGIPAGTRITAESVRGVQEATFAVNVAKGNIHTNTLLESKQQWTSIETMAKGDLVPPLKALSGLGRILGGIH